MDENFTFQQQQLAYSAFQHCDLKTNTIDCQDTRAYLAASKKHDPDTLSYYEVMQSPESEEWIKAMKLEILTLVQGRTWKRIKHSQVPTHKNGVPHPVLKGTWVFKLKIFPDGSPLKFKARYCVRGDLQKEGVDCFKTYAPVVQWSTVQTLLTLILANDWVTKQVDYTNAFAQAKLNEHVYIKAPAGFDNSDKQPKVLRLIKSLYGLRQAPCTFFEKLKAGLLERGFIQSNHDPCLFMKKNYHSRVC